MAIHRKPGYDPVEPVVDPEMRVPALNAGRKLMQKKLVFRYLMDLIPREVVPRAGSRPGGRRR